MSSLVHVPNATRVSRYFRPSGTNWSHYVPLKSKFGIAFVSDSISAPEATVISGKDAGTTVSTIAPNQRATVRVGIVNPYKYTAIVAINPEFNAIATVQHPNMIEPNELTQLDLVVTAHKEVDLAKLEWYCRVYLFE